MKPGMTLIEVALTLFLYSFLASVLFVSFSQLQMASRVTESFIEVDMRSAVVMHQMSNDIAGAFISQLSRSVVPLSMSTIFMAKHKENNFDMLTCITNNPIAVYDTVKPRVARVVYRLVADKEREGTFRLLRQESSQLDLKAFEKTGVEAIRSYKLAHNIKSCSFSCTLLDYQKPKKEQQKQQPQDVTVTARTFKDWIFDPKKAKEQKMPPLPYAITFKFVFWDDQHRREWPVEFSILIASFEPYSEKKKKVEGKPAVAQQNKVKVQFKIPENVARFLAKRS